MHEAGSLSHASHWGAFSARWDGQKLEITPRKGDADPSPILGNFENALHHKARIAHPMIRKGWLEGAGPQSRHDGDDFVQLSWDRALDITAEHLSKVYRESGPQSVFGGSYGWASAGRFHHSQSQLHRFLNLALGGYVRSVNNYSAGAALVLFPHIVGSMEAISRRNVTWTQMVEHTETVLAFGGLPLKNTAVASGGISSHIERQSISAAQKNGARFVLVSPLGDDLPPEAGAEWLQIRPGTDVAMMLAMAYAIVEAGKHDTAFLKEYCHGFERFEDYLLGRTDGQPKTPDWASSICAIPARTIRELALSLPGKRTLVVTSQSLQRAEFGEQPIWMATVLAAMLGQIGLPGGGYNYGLGSLAHYGKRRNAVPIPTFPQGSNPVDDYIPVARIADMLLNPGGPYHYNGEARKFPSIRLAYWVGGNPYHHHQDLARLQRGFDKVETIIVHDSAWTPMARRADIVLPATMTLERNDICAGQTDPVLIAMHKLAEPYQEARDDYAIFSALAERLGAGSKFTENRTAEEWLEHLYDKTRSALSARNLDAPDFKTFWRMGEIELPQQPDDGGALRAFRQDPANNPLQTPSGKVEIFSETIASFGYPDCAGHPKWFEHVDAPAREGEFFLIANQPARRLHSQLDFGAYSMDGKVKGREVVRINPDDAARLGLTEGQIVRLHNDRGSCLAALALSSDIMPGVLHLPTGAWYDPVEGEDGLPMCVHGNPNVLTRDAGTSSLAQGCIGQITTASIEPYTGALPPVRVHTPPDATARS